MILCASPDPKEIHKTICTLEYGAKAKCIVRGPHTPIKDKNGIEDSSSAVILGSRVAAMDQFIYKLQMENKLREKDCNEAHKKLMKKEEEVAALRELLEEKGSGSCEEEINLKVNERTKILKLELERKLEECQRMAEEFVELERRRMEERILQQQEEVEMLRRRLEEIELEFRRSKDGNVDDSTSKSFDGCGFAKRLLGIYADEDPGMVKSMDLDMGDQEPFVRDVRHVDAAVSHQHDNNGIQGLADFPHLKPFSEVQDGFGPRFGDRVCLSTVFEEEEAEEEDNKGSVEDEAVEKVIIEDKRIYSSPGINSNTSFFASSPQNFELTRNVSTEVSGKENCFWDRSDDMDPASFRRLRIQNIFTLCGNNRELLQQLSTATPAKKRSEATDLQSSPVVNTRDQNIVKSMNNECGQTLYDGMELASKENHNPFSDSTDMQLEVYVKWEASRENPGKFITTLKVVKDATLADLRKLIEIYLGADNQAFTFLVLGVC